MADEATTTTAAETEQTETTTTENDVEKQAFLERLSKESGKRKEAEKQVAAFQKQITDLQTQMEERESAGLPELERERKRAEQLEQRTAAAEKRAEEAEARALNTERSRWVATAASGQNFIDPDDATRFVDLADIESADDAEKAVKRVAKAKAHLIKSEERQLPGRVLENGKPATKDKPEVTDPMAEDARIVSESLKQFLANRNR